MLFVPIPRARLHALIDKPEDLAGMPLDTPTPAWRYLVRYLTLLTQLDEADDDERLRAHIGTTLLDLIALALGASRDAAHHAQMRGVRAARTQEVIARIAAGFADPAFSARRCGCGARRLGAIRPGLAAGNRHVIFGAGAGASAAAGTRHAGGPGQRQHENRRDRPRLRVQRDSILQSLFSPSGLASPRRPSEPTVTPGTRT